MAQQQKNAAKNTVHNKRGLRKTRDGVVLSTNMTKTVVVGVRTSVRHPRYHKFVRRVRKHYAHDEKSECQVGDTVRIVETRPLSKLKRWRVEAILRKAVAA